MPGLLDFFGGGAGGGAPFNFQMPGGADPMTVGQGAPEAMAAPGKVEGLMTGGPTGKPSRGLLGGFQDFMSTPDGRGLTMSDKLFAAGGVLQGDSGGAASYLANQRQAFEANAEKERSRALAQQGLAALRGAIGPDGQLDIQKYLASLPAGADPMEGLKMRDALRPDITPMSGSRGAVHLFDRGKGAFVPGGIEGDPREAELYNPDGSINETVLASQVRAAEEIAAAQRRGKPLAPRSGGRSGGKSKFGSIPTDQLLQLLAGG